MNTDVVILCGGIGSRLTPLIADRPKPMADINGEPFLNILINHYKSFGIKRFILCTGHMSGFIENYYALNNPAAEIVISKEDTPLGTAGAVKNAEPLINTNSFFVINGDSFCNVNLAGFHSFHIRTSASASMVLTTAATKDPQSCGSVITDNSQKITGFIEKTTAYKTPLINAGIYIFNKSILSLIPPAIKMSLEYDLFPKIVNSGFYGYTTNKTLFDIGTPDKYYIAVKELKQSTR
ncbi:MAG: sugar phosphate nucleotidyltransferase [Nitrospirae bacterium YQR-1]